jgi:MFS family permease
MTHKSGTLAVCFLGLLASLQLIDPTVANTALVKAADALQMKGATLALGASISTLAQAASVLWMGCLGDRFGRRRMLVVSLLLSIAGDGIALTAPTAAVFLLGRALVGVGVGSALASSFAAVRCVSRPNQLGQALGLWNSLIIAGFIGGSLLGGWLADSSWRLALGLVPLIAVLCLPLVPALLPEMPANPQVRADGPGLISIAAAMVLFLTGVNHAVNGLTAPAFWAPTLGGVLLFGVHLLIERRRQQPIFPVALYTRGCFAAAIVSGIAWNFAQAVVQLQTSNFWQLVQRYSTSQVALAQLPLLICFGAGGVLAGRWMAPGRRTSQLMAGGAVVLVLGLVLLAGVRASSGYAALVAPLVLVGLGLAFLSVPQSALFVQEAPASSFGAVTAFRTTTGQLGFALGFAASGALVNGFGYASLRERLLQLGATPAQLPDLLTKVRAALSSGALSHAHGTSPKVLRVLADSYASGFTATMLVSALLVTLLIVITLLLLAIGAQQANTLQDPSADSLTSAIRS